MSIKVAVIGLGKQNEQYLMPCLRLDTDFEIVAVSSRTQVKLDRFANLFGATKKYLNWQDAVLDEQIDAIVVASSPELHYQVLKLAIQDNKHIFVEKPPTQNLEQIKELLELQKTSKSKIFVGYNFAYTDFYKQVNQKITPKFLKMRFVSSRPREIGYHHQSILEYAMFSMLIHPLAVAINQFGNVKNHRHNITWLTDTTFVMNNFLECERGNVAIEWGNYTGKFETDFEWLGSKGEVAKVSNLQEIEWQNLPSLKDKQTLNIPNSPRIVGFGNAGYQNQFSKWKEIIGNNLPDNFEQNLQIYKVLEEILEQN